MEGVGISRKIIRKIYYSVIDAKERLLNQRDEMTPPKILRVLVGESNGYEAVGDEFLRYFIEYAKLKPNEKVLDVGCGVGRVARSLTQYLNKSGSYEGFDILAQGINWASKNITTRYSNFHFKHVDVYNKRYNPNGNLNASQFCFPYPSNSFDFVFLASVFTHMLPKDLEHYLSEILRVMNEKGRCLITYFLLNDESTSFIETKRSNLDFKHLNPDGYRILDPSEPEHAIAYEEKYIRSLYQKNQLNIKEPIKYGSWCGRKSYLSFQDIIIANK